MTATLLAELRDRTTEVERGELSGIDLDNETSRFDGFVSGLKERIAKLPKDETRDKYLETVNEAFAKLKAAKPKKEDKKPEAAKEAPEPTKVGVTPPVSPEVTKPVEAPEPPAAPVEPVVPTPVAEKKKK